MSITEFLLARIAEDEAAARESERSYWNPSPDTRVRWRADWPQGSVSIMGSGKQALAYHCDPNAAAHIVRHDPARVLAECAAKRAIVERQLSIWGQAMAGALNDVEDEANEGLDFAIRALASVYADHSDYLPGWAL